MGITTVKQEVDILLVSSAVLQQGSHLSRFQTEADPLSALGAISNNIRGATCSITHIVLQSSLLRIIYWNRTISSTAFSTNTFFDRAKTT